MRHPVGAQAPVLFLEVPDEGVEEEGLMDATAILAFSVGILTIAFLIHAWGHG